MHFSDEKLTPKEFAPQLGLPWRQFLGLCAFMVGITVSVPGWGTNIPQAKKKKRERERENLICSTESY